MGIFKGNIRHQVTWLNKLRFMLHHLVQGCKWVGSTYGWLGRDF